MLTPGNRKLGGRRIWGFGLPSGTPDVCPGMSAVCQTHCYAVAVERYRPTAAAAYRRNLARSRRRDFVVRLRAFLIAHAVAVVRVHTGGDFYRRGYARKWLRVMGRSPRVTFYFYTRSWRVPAIRSVIEQMADLPNCVVWYSCDRDTGVPAAVPARVRLAWLATADDDVRADDLGDRGRGGRRVRRERARTAGRSARPVAPRPPAVPRVAVRGRAKNASRSSNPSRPVTARPSPLRWWPPQARSRRHRGPATGQRTHPLVGRRRRPTLHHFRFRRRPPHECR